MKPPTISTFLLLFVVSCTIVKPNGAKNPNIILNPTLSAMYYDPDPATDGVLSLEIDDTEQSCYSQKSSVPIKTTFHNLSSESVTIPIFKQNNIGLKPILTSQTDYIYYDPETPRDYFLPTLIDLVLLSSGQSYESIYEYHLPKFIWISKTQGNTQVSTPSPGEYLLKFIFENRLDHDAHAWKGHIASNQIEICFTQ